MIATFAAGSRAKLSKFASVGKAAYKKLAVAGGIAAAAVGLAFARAASAIDDLAKSSRKLLGNNGATGALKGIRQAAGEAGVSLTEVDTGLEKMLETLGKAKEGDASALKALERVGLTAKDLKNLKPEQALLKIADGIQAIGDTDRKITAARGIFGRGGGSLVGLFNQGSGAIRKAQSDMVRFGQALTGVEASGVEQMNDSLGRSRLMLDGFTKQMTVKLAPSITALSEGFMTWIDGLGGVGEASETSFNFMIDIAGKFLDKLELIKAGLMAMKKGLLDAGASALSLVDKIELPGADKRNRDNLIEKRLQQFPEHRREQARKIIGEGRYTEERVTFGRIAEGLKGEADATGEGINAIKEKRKEEGTAGERFKKFIFKANESAADKAAAATSQQAADQAKITDELEKQLDIQKELAGASAGQGERGLTAFSGAVFDNNAQIAAAAKVRTGNTGSDGMQNSLLKQIADNTRAPVAVAG
jgi:hypothetical protein